MSTRAVVTFGLIGLGFLYLATRRDMEPAAIDLGDPCKEPPSMPTIPSGWRRASKASQIEVSRANALLSSGAPIGTFRDEGSFGLIVEPHCHPRQGWHRGVSVLERSP